MFIDLADIDRVALRDRVAVVSGAGDASADESSPLGCSSPWASEAQGAGGRS